MHPKHFTRAALLMVGLAFISVLFWELYLRSKGYSAAYDDGGPLWSHKRNQVYQPIDKSTVFIGSSRIKFDLDIETWRALTGDEPVQLAIQGNSPRPVLEHLANDEKFKGRLVVDVTEPLFFSESATEAGQLISFYDYNFTPAQKASFALNKGLEGKLLFLDKDNFSLNAMIDQLQIPSRPGVFVFPVFPFDFDRNSIDRQSYMTPKFLRDTLEQNKVKAIWNFFRSMNRRMPPKGDTLRNIIASVKTLTDKIRARGGQVIFVRTPSSNPMLMGENMGYPRDQYWEPLLAATGCPGIHFQDYPVIANFICPELSHLSPKDAIVFTREFARILHEEYKWRFPRMNSPFAFNILPASSTSKL